MCPLVHLIEAIKEMLFVVQFIAVLFLFSHRFIVHILVQLEEENVSIRDSIIITINPIFSLVLTNTINKKFQYYSASSLKDLFVRIPYVVRTAHFLFILTCNPLNKKSKQILRISFLSI